MQSDYVIILLEIVIVLIVGRIKVPGLWAEIFVTAFFGSIPAFAVIGLLVWLFCFPFLGFLLITFDGDITSLMAEDLSSNPVGIAALSTLRFIGQHLIFALAFGHLISIQAWFPVVGRSSIAK